MQGDVPCPITAVIEVTVRMKCIKLLKKPLANIHNASL